MKDALMLIAGMLIGIALAVAVELMLPAEPPKIIRYEVPKYIEKRVEIEKECQATPPVIEPHCIPPSLVADIIRQCRAGTLDFSIPNFTIRKQM